MADSMLEEIWRVRAQLLKDHGGWEGYYKQVDKVYREHEKYARRQKLKPQGPELWEVVTGARRRQLKKECEATPLRRPDPILDEIQRVRQKLLEEHGGLDGYYKHVQKIERARRARTSRRKSARTKRKTPAR